MNKTSITEPCVNFLKRQAESLNLPFNVYRLFDEKSPIVVISWIGRDPSLPAIMLNSHMDVVPAFPEHWSHPPFAAEIDGDGRIFARGAQDMKAIGTLYLAAIRALKKSGRTLERTLHLTYVPDEETDAVFGMKSFVHHDVFKSLNIGFAMDEGMTNENDVYRLFYGERSNWSILSFLAQLFCMDTILYFFSFDRDRVQMFRSHGPWINTLEKYSR